MPMQCWCYNCAGRYVSRTTFKAHGRKSKPDPPVPAQEEKVSIESLNNLDSNNAEACDETSEQSDSDSDCDSEASSDDMDDATIFADEFWEHDEHGRDSDVDSDSEKDDEDSFDRQDLTLFILDWMCNHKITDSAARDRIDRKY